MPQNSQDVIDRRRASVAGLYLKGWTQMQIAQKEGVDQSQISLDLAAIREQWRASTVFDFNEAKLKELARIDLLETTYWQAWEDSMKPLIKKSTKVRSPGKELLAVEEKKPVDANNLESTETTEERLGDPRYLDGVMKCIQKRVDILGLDAPFKVAQTDTQGKHVVGQWAIVDFTNGHKPPPIDE